MTPQPGDFGLTQARPPIADKLIKLGEWANGDGHSPYSHAILALDNGQLIEADPHGARIRPLTDYPDGTVTWSTWPLTGAARYSITLHGRELAGTPYSWLDYASVALHRFHLRPPGLKRYIAATGHMICSQLVDEAYWRAGLHMFDDQRWPGDVTPAGLAAVLAGPAVRR